MKNIIVAMLVLVSCNGQPTERLTSSDASLDSQVIESVPDTALSCSQTGELCSATELCCSGNRCVNFPEKGGHYCVALCNAATDCPERCCVPLKSGVSACVSATYCSVPSSLTPGTYFVYVTRTGTDNYTIDGSNLLIQTHLCAEEASATRIGISWAGKGQPDSLIQFSSGVICDVTNIVTIP